MNTYDEGKDGEETAIHTRGKIGSENKNKVFTEEEKANYLNDLRNKYKAQKSIEEQFAEAKLVPEKDKENFINSKEAAILMNPEVFVEKNINLLTKMFKKSAEEILNNPDEYAYKYIQETRNKEVYNREFLIKYQEKLEERIKNEKDPFKRKELEKGLFRKMSPSFSIYHNGYIDENGEVAIYTNPKNEKWVNGKGEEYIFNIETGRIVKDGINNGTFNIAGNDKNSFNPIDTIVHFGLDVASWENYGLGKNDVLTKEQRKIFSEMGAPMQWLELSFQDRSPAWIARLEALWTATVQADHSALPRHTVQDLAAGVVQVLRTVAHLTVALDDTGAPVGVLGVSGHSLELFFLPPDQQGTGLGSRLFQHAMAKHYLAQITVWDLFHLCGRISFCQQRLQ